MGRRGPERGEKRACPFKTKKGAATLLRRKYRREKRMSSTHGEGDKGEGKGAGEKCRLGKGRGGVFLKRDVNLRCAEENDMIVQEGVCR